MASDITTDGHSTPWEPWFEGKNVQLIGSNLGSCIPVGKIILQTGSYEKTFGIAYIIKCVISSKRIVMKTSAQAVL